MNLSNLKLRTLTSLILLALLILMFKSILISTYLLIVFGVLAIVEFIEISKKIFLKKIFSQIASMLFITYISIFCYLFFFFLNHFFLKIILFTLILGCISSDIGGFAFGKLFKGPKLTKISPKKTYSGVIGSFLFSSISVSVIIFLFTSSYSHLILLVAIFTSLSCQLGDLFFSYLKRKAKIKDTGTILPGHGGILDRLDGILFGVPTGYIILILIM